MGTEQEDATDFKGVGVEIWTSFNTLHTRNNMDTVNWAVENGVNADLGHQDLVVDFGCGCVSRIHVSVSVSQKLFSEQEKLSAKWLDWVCLDLLRF
jgi:hypothetical protein